MEFSCFLYSLICLGIYFFSLYKKLDLSNIIDLLHTFFSSISPLKYIYKLPKDEKNIITISTVFLMHLALLFLFSSSILSFIGLQNTNNSILFIFTLSIWLFIYKIDLMSHQKYPVQMENNNNINLPNLPFLDFTRLFNRQNRIDLEMVIQIDADGEIEAIDREQFEAMGIMVGGEPQNDRNRIRNDNQNVHDSGVTATIQKSVSNLKKNTDLKLSPEETLAQLSVLIDNCKDTLIREKARKTLETIEKSTIPIVSIGMTMAEVIQLFWNRIHHSNFTDHQKQLLQENLIKELADGSTLSIKPVCSTGIVTRIIQSGIEIDDEIDIKPKWALRQELLQQSYQIWKKLYQKITDNEKEAIKKLQPNKEETIIVEKFKKNLENTIREQAYSTYVNPGLLNKNDVDKELDSWINEIV